MKFKVLAIIGAAMLSAGCAANSVNQVTAGQCPPISPLATADYLALEQGMARINGATLTCFIDKETNQLLAEVTLSGSTDMTGTELPFFVAALDEKGEIVSRTQFKVTPSATDFSYPLPKLTYGKKDVENVKARLVVGFVLTPAQLAQNRDAYSKMLGLTR